MAAAAYPVALFMPAQHARARFFADGSAVVQTGTQEFGTGVLTAMTQVAADSLGLPLDSVRFEAGDRTCRTPRRRSGRRERAW